MAIWLGVSTGPGPARVIATAGPGETVFKARLPSPPSHSRALATLCEAIALWTGEQVHGVLAAGGEVSSFDRTRWLGQDGLISSALFELVVTDARQPRRHRDRLTGLGEFRDLRQLVFFEVAQ